MDTTLPRDRQAKHQDAPAPPIKGGSHIATSHHHAHHRHRSASSSVHQGSLPSLPPVHPLANAQRQMLGARQPPLHQMRFQAQRAGPPPNIPAVLVRHTNRRPHSPLPSLPQSRTRPTTIPNSQAPTQAARTHHAQTPALSQKGKLERPSQSPPLPIWPPTRNQRQTPPQTQTGIRLHPLHPGKFSSRQPTPPAHHKPAVKPPFPTGPKPKQIHRFQPCSRNQLQGHPSCTKSGKNLRGGVRKRSRRQKGGRGARPAAPSLRGRWKTEQTEPRQPPLRPPHRSNHWSRVARNDAVQ